MTISLLLVVMRILTVTTRYKLEIFPVSGAPAAQQAWGWHRLGLPAFLQTPSHEPVWNTQALPELEVPLTSLFPGSRGPSRTGERFFSLQLLQKPRIQPHVVMVGRAQRRRMGSTDSAGGRRSEGHSGLDHTLEQAASSGETPILLL